MSASIDWEPLISVEARFVSSGITSNSSRYFSGRLDRLYTCHDDDYEFESEFMSTDALKCNYIDKQDKGLYNDIPRQKNIDISDSELLLWSAFISDFRQVATKLPVYSSMMVVNGIPPCLRGLAWLSMAEARSPTLESLYDSLAEEWTPFVKIIGRDLNRTFPELTLFQEKGGKGQLMLGKILRAYSAYDIQVGYCQGLTFLTGPLLLHMSEKEAFCVLVRLMENYDLRSMFTADMAGLPLRIYQFEHLFAEHLPELWKHFESLGITSVYASQWFLSFFAVTCPLDILVRVYDLLFAEGAIPTMFRVALSVLKRNQAILLEFGDEELILERLLGPCLWDVYGYDADKLCADIAEFDSQMLSKIDALQTQYVSEGRKKQRVSKRSSRSNNSGNATNRKEGLSTSPSGMYRLTSWLSASTSTLINGSTSSISIPASMDSIDTASFMEENYDVQSSADSSSLKSESTRTSTSMNMSMMNRKHPHRTSQLDYLENQLDMTKVALELERQERQCDASAVQELLDLLEKESLSEEAKYQCSQMKQRFNLPVDDDSQDDHEDQDDTLVHIKQTNEPPKNACKSCHRLTMEYAVLKAREASARQEVDSLTDKLAHLSANNGQISPPDSPETEPTHALSRKGSRISSMKFDINNPAISGSGSGISANTNSTGTTRTLLQPLPQRRWSVMRK